MALVNVCNILVNTDNIEGIEEIERNGEYKTILYMSSGRDIILNKRLRDVLKRINSKNEDD